MTNQTVSFLLIEDDAVDRMAIERGFKEMRLLNPLVVARDGIEGLDHLRGTGGKQKLQPPYLIMLDLNMPRMNGIEFLEAVRGDPQLSSVVVFVMTTSKRDEDRVAAYEHHVAGYLLKGDLKGTFRQALQMLDYYWQVVEFP